MIFMHPGLTLFLRKPELTDIDTIARWTESPEFALMVESAPSDVVRNGVERANAILQTNADDFGTSKYLLAANKSTGEPVGMAMICKIDWKNRHAEYSYIIGNPKFRGSLAAGDMNITVYSYMFNEWNLNKVYGYVFEGNNSSARLNLFGGTLDGKLRQHEPTSYRYKDVQLFSILQHEFREFVKNNTRGVLRKHISEGLL
jgi:RimJ/RimL family protein N-acetyltransferase